NENDFEGLEDETQISLYRVAQEALTNALKHSGASKASISSSTQGTELVLIIADNGSGFEPETIFEEKDMRFGIIGMKERILNCGGSLNIISGIGKGTEIIARAPLSPRAGEKG
nr:ATP-binding protein [bacterium]